MLHQPNAHTDGDIIVFFRKSDVVVAGDIFVTTTFPVINLAQGGSLNGIVAALNRIIDITVPKDKQEGGTYVIPGPRPRDRRSRRRGLPRHGDDHPRSVPGRGQEEDDAGAGEGRAAGARLRGRATARRTASGRPTRSSRPRTAACSQPAAVTSRAVSARGRRDMSDARTMRDGRARSSVRGTGGNRGLGRPAGARAGAAGRGSARRRLRWASAPIDLTGYWVSIVNEDWRWRMVTPPKGDYASVPLNDEARRWPTPGTCRRTAVARPTARPG